MKIFYKLLFAALIMLFENRSGVAQKATTIKNVRTTPRKLHSQIRNQCKTFKTFRMKQLCRTIASDPNVVGMGSQVRAFAKNADEQKFSESKIRKRASGARSLNSNWTGFTVSPIPSRSLPETGFQCKKSCPSHETIASGRTPASRSTSPWQACSHYDPLRFPQWLKLGFCSCKGCINPTTKKEDTSFVSVPITIDITVLRRDPNLSFSECIIPRKGCVKTIQKVIIGCTCTLPTTL
ncbi:uncharacterized protein LOC120339463 [Styela clava]